MPTWEKLQVLSHELTSSNWSSEDLMLNIPLYVFNVHKNEFLCFEKKGKTDKDFGIHLN